jgi:hypothetical protein
MTKIKLQLLRYAAEHSIGMVTPQETLRPRTEILDPRCPKKESLISGYCPMIVERLRMELDGTWSDDEIWMRYEKSTSSKGRANWNGQKYNTKSPNAHPLEIELENLKEVKRQWKKHVLMP